MVESAASVATNPAASVAERYDAQVDLQKSGLESLIPQPQVQEAIDHIRQMYEDADLAKAMGRQNVIPFPKKGGPTSDRSKRGGQSVFLDEFQVASQGEYWDRPGMLGFDSMRAMVEQTPILNGIVLTRIRQVLRFCRPQMSQSDTGFVIAHVDPTVELGKEQQESTKLLQQFIINCGWEFDPRRRKQLKRDSFSQFMAKSVRDSLTMDAAPIETEFKRNRALGLDGFYAVDGASIRLCTDEGYEGRDEVYAVQVIQGRIRTAYTYDDLVYEVRNPRTDVDTCGYGYSETEMLIKVITYLLNACTYNGSFFDQNAIPRGFLSIYGNYEQSDLAAFKRYWNGMVRGVRNAHNAPVMASKDRESGADWTEIGGQLDEMAFAKWLSFLTSIACAIYGTVPEEISMQSFADSKSALSGSDTEEKLVSSADKGLRPLLGHYESVLSDFVIQTFSPEYNLRFVGLDGDDSTKRFEMRKLTATWNEGRAEIGMDPLKGPIGDAPLNPTLLGVWQQTTGIGMPEPEEEDFGDPDAEDDADARAPGGLSSAPGAGNEKPPGDAGKPSGGPDFGTAGDDGEKLGKSMTLADFGLPDVYKIEV